MLFITLLSILSSNAVSNTKEKSIMYSRLLIISLILTICVIQSNIIIKPLSKSIALYGSLFNVDLFTQSSNLLILYISSGILILSGFYSKSLFNFSMSDPKVIHTDNNNGLLPNKYKGDLENYISNIAINKKSDIYNITEYALTILFILCGAISLISASDLISIFLSIELQSYGLYILCTLHRNSESATGSALMYFLLGGLSSCFILFGSAILYSNSGTTNLDNIYVMFSIGDAFNNVAVQQTNSLNYNDSYVTIALIMIMVGFLFKVSAAPFHFWSPNVYDGIPTIVTTFVAIIAKISIFAFILVITLQLGFVQVPYDYSMTAADTSVTAHSIEETEQMINNTMFDSIYKYGQWKNIILFSSLMSLLIGSLLGLTQNRIKRLFAYSTISHVGFILLALSVASVESIQGYIFYIIQYTISNLNIFLVLVSIGFTLFRYTYKQSFVNGNTVAFAQHTQIKDTTYSPIQLITQVKGYFYINSFIAISFAITLFSFVGIPPLIGFFAKQMVLSAALDNGYVFMTFVGIITSVIGAVYYLNLVKEVFFTEPTDYNNNLSSIQETDIQKDFGTLVNKISINSPLSIAIGILTILILTFIYKPSDWFIIANILSITLFNI